MVGSSTKEKKLSNTQALRVAEARRDRLKHALRLRGIVLPSLNVDAAAYGSQSQNVLIDLGRCSLDVAGKLIEALLEGPWADGEFDPLSDDSTRETGQE